jgi:hypothetical protein
MRVSVARSTRISVLFATKCRTRSATGSMIMESAYLVRLNQIQILQLSTVLRNLLHLWYLLVLRLPVAQVVELIAWDIFLILVLAAVIPMLRTVYPLAPLSLVVALELGW